MSGSQFEWWSQGQACTAANHLIPTASSWKTVWTRGGRRQGHPRKLDLKATLISHFRPISSFWKPQFSDSKIHISVYFWTALPSSFPPHKKLFSFFLPWTDIFSYVNIYTLLPHPIGSKSHLRHEESGWDTELRITKSLAQISPLRQTIQVAVGNT